MKYLVLLVFLLLPSAIAHAASTHHYSCADSWTGNYSVTGCSTDTFTVNGSSYVYDDGGSPNFTLSPSTTYYVSASLTGSGCVMVGVNPDTSNGNICKSTSFTDESFTTDSSGGLHPFMEPRNGAQGNPTGYTGDISEWCISDTLGDCTTPTPTTTPATACGLSTSSPCYTRDTGDTIFMLAVLVFLNMFAFLSLAFSSFLKRPKHV